MQTVGTRPPFFAGEPLYATVEEIAAHFVREMRVVQPKGPYYLGGGCEGGIVVTEVVRQLQASGHEIGLFVLWATRRLGYDRRDLVAALRYLAPGESSANGEQAKRNLRLREAICETTERYEPRLFSGRMEFIQAAKQLRGYRDPAEGWDELTTEGVERHVLPGNHTTYFDVHSPPVARCLKAILESVQAKWSDARDGRPSRGA